MLNSKHILHYIFIVYIIISCSFFCYATENQDQGVNKASNLRQLALESENYIVTLEPKEFLDYVYENPRPYELVVYFTSSNCQLCTELEKEFKLASKFYGDENCLYPQRENQKLKRAVFFTIVRYSEKWKEIYDSLQVQTVPIIMVSSPKTAIVPKESRNSYLRDFTWLISSTDGHVTAHKFLEFINKRTGRDVQYKVNVFTALTVVVVILGSISIFYYLFVTFNKFFLNPKLWFVLSLLIYAVCSAGIVYNIIHNVPYVSYNDKGEMEWFSNQQRMQLGMEGVAMAVAIVISSLCLIGTTRLNKLQIGKYGKIITCCILFIGAFFLIKQIEKVYANKGWYNPQFWPPENYIRGPLMRDQGTTV